MPVVCGWRRSVVEARARRLLCKNEDVKVPNNASEEKVQENQFDVADVNNIPPSSSMVSSNIGLELIDLFPECPQSELDYLQLNVIDQYKLDGSLIRMREAMIEVSKCTQLIENGLKNRVSASRVIYLTLLTLSFLFSQNKLVSLPERVLPKSLSKPFPFDRIFKDTIKCVLSRADFVQMKTTEKEMMECVGSPELQSARIGFGLLF